MYLLGISGSLRLRSHNTALLTEAAAVAQRAGVRTEIWPYAAEIPPFNEDRERPAPALVVALRARVATGAGLVIATPEYNGSVPGQLKNILDWLSRPYGDHVLIGKPALVLSASASDYGAAWARQAVTGILTTIGAEVHDTGYGLSRAHENLDESGTLRPEAERRALATAVRGFVASLHRGRLTAEDWDRERDRVRS